MRTEGPFTLPCTAGQPPTANSPIPIRDYSDKTVEVANLTSGSLDIQVKVATAWSTVLNVTQDGAYVIPHAGFQMRVDATMATGATLEVSLVVMNGRAD